MDNVATLGLSIDSSPLLTFKKALYDTVPAAKGAETASTQLARARHVAFGGNVFAKGRDDTMTHAPHIQEAIDAGVLSADPLVIKRRAGRLFVFRGIIIQLTFDDDGNVSRRTCTICGRHDHDLLGRPFVLGARVVEEIFEPPIPEISLPPLAPAAVGIGAKPARARKRAGNAAADKRSRISRLRSRKAAMAKD